MIMTLINDYGTQDSCLFRNWLRKDSL